MKTLHLSSGLPSPTVCQNCVELDSATLAGIIVTDIIATLLLALGVYCFAGHEMGRFSRGKWKGQSAYVLGVSVCLLRSGSGGGSCLIWESLLQSPKDSSNWSLMELGCPYSSCWHSRLCPAAIPLPAAFMGSHCPILLSPC